MSLSKNFLYIKILELTEEVTNNKTKRTIPGDGDAEISSDKLAKALHDLVICVKYTLLDLESTRREKAGIQLQLDKYIEEHHTKDEDTEEDE